MTKPLPHGALKQALLDHAMQAARSGTLDDLSLRQVSRTLGVSAGAAYRHFADKDALMRRVAQLGFDQMADAFEAALPWASTAASAEEAIARFTGLARAYVRFAQENYGLWRLMFGPHGLPGTPAPEARPSTYDWLGKSLRELADQGVIAPPDAAAQFFAWTTIHGLSDLQASPAVTGTKADVTAAQCRLILAALRPATS
ncbi:MAG: TetR/AcrR family transcriptional regulator [Pseudomonadota bacterium]